MKICLISNLFNPYIIGGAEVYLETIANKLSKDNEVIVITTKPFSDFNSLKYSKEIKNNISIYKFYPLNLYHTYNAGKNSFWKKPIWHFIDIWNLHSYYVIKNILTIEKPDVVHTHNLGGLSKSTFSAIKSLDLIHIHTLHDFQLISPWSIMHRNGTIIDKFNFFERWYIKIMNKLTKSIDVVLAPSQFMLDTHINNAYFPNSIHKKLPLGIELDNLIKINKNYDIIKILYVGQIEEHKGIHVLIEAFKKLKKDNVTLNIVGKGSYMKHLMEMANTDKRIVFHGFVPDYTLKELYQKSNIVIIPSIWYDNSPVVIYESFRAGTPVVASAIGGIPELIEDEFNGFLFKSGNVEKLQVILENLIEDQSILKRLEKGAFESVKKYGIVLHVRKLEEIYNEF